MSTRSRSLVRASWSLQMGATGCSSLHGAEEAAAAAAPLLWLTESTVHQCLPTLQLTRRGSCHS